MFLCLTSWRTCSFHLRNAHECFCSRKSPPTFTSRRFDWLLVCQWELNVRMQSQLYFLNMLMICRSLWLWHTAGPKRPGSWRQTYKLLLFETFSTSHLSPQRCSDGARPEVIFHSLMCVSGGKQRWGFLFKCKYIISHMVYTTGAYMSRQGLRSSCIALLRLSVIGHLQKSSVPVPHNLKPIYRNMVLPGSRWV